MADKDLGTYAIELRKITKHFGDVTANDAVDLTVRHGEILAILGENGSGKTTLMNMISGIYHPDEGEIFLDGRKVVITSPTDAIRMGIGMIHQHFKLVDLFTAMDNIVLGTKGKYEKPAVLRKKIETLSKKYGLEVDPDKHIYDMSVSEKQTVEVLKVLYQGARILILDEPTAVLTPQETDKLFLILRRMRDQGTAIIIITHKLAEVMAISDRVTILRKGRSVQTIETQTTTEQKLTELMVGKQVTLMIDRPVCKKKKTILTVKGLSVKKQDGAMALRNVSFMLRSGEILGVAGIAGSGQKELCEVLAGLRKPEYGEVLYEGCDILHKNAAQREEIGLTMGFVPEDRIGMGLVGSMGMTDNILLREYRKQKGILLKKSEARNEARNLVDRFDIMTPSTEFPVRMMSGGNVQKVLLGREINRSPEVLVAAYPVRGLDINSSYTVYGLLNEQKMRGAAVLFVGEDLDVLLAISDRILVLCHGEVTGIIESAAASKEEVGLLMAGKRGMRKDGTKGHRNEGASRPYQEEEAERPKADLSS